MLYRFTLLLLLIPGFGGWHTTAAETNTLSFAACMSRALASNLSVREQQLEWLISKWSLRREYFAFEPALTISATRRRPG